MKTNYFVLYFLLLFTFSANSQDSINIQKSYKDYFKLPRESVFIHTNKTTYLVGEKIWLKTYILDRKNNLSSKASSNIHVDLFDSKGNTILKNLVLNKKGVGLGQIDLDTTLHSGIYFLKATTNWMKNFKEDDTYVQKIQIINSKKENAFNIQDDAFDVQFLPEGGNLVENTINVVGIKAIDNLGKGIRCEGSIQNSKGEVVASLKTNLLGMGKFLFTPKENESYKAFIKIGALKKIEKELPKAASVGISLKVDNYRKDNVIITLNTNDKTLEKVAKNYNLVIHKDGELSSIPVTINQKSTKVALPKKLLFLGVNTITLFNKENKPIVQRMFFNDFNFKTHSINAVNIKIEGDSTNYDIISRSLAPNEVLRASISVLPSGTKSYNQENNILSTFLLKPYVNGVIENPAYYFNGINRQKKYNLDLLLLTQGWTRYSWDDIFNNPVKPKFDFENGITFNGKLHSNLENVTSLIMHPTEKNKSLFLVYDKRGKFHLKNFYPFIKEEVYFTYFDKKGNMKKPILSMSPIERNSDKFITLDKYTDNFSFLSDNDQLPNIFIEEDFELLEEVKLKAKVKRDDILVNARVTDIGEEEIRNYPTITDFIQRSGFDVIFGDGAIRRLGQVYIYSRRPLTASAPKNNISDLRGIRGQPTPEPVPDPELLPASKNVEANLAMPTIIVDGIQLTEFAMLYNMPTRSIERVVVDKTGIGMGINGFGGVIKIFTRKGPIPSRSNNNYNNSFTYLVKYGFLKSEKFYSPRYVFRNQKAYQRFGAVSWHNDIVVSSKKEKKITINGTLFDSLDFYIEGFTNLGNFISQKLVIQKTEN